MNIIQVYKQFPTQEACLAHLEAVRWNGTPVCPYCKATRVTAAPKEFRYHCNVCNTSFSVTVRTIFHKTKVDMQKWFLAISLVLNARKGISARQLARDIEVNKNTAWSMLMRLRQAMLDDGALLEGLIESDETYIGGKERNKHNDKKLRQGRGSVGKTPIVGIIQRGGDVKAIRVKKTDARTLQTFIRANAKPGSHLMTDEWAAYRGLDARGFLHSTVSHGRGQYVDGIAHTNSIENFWALLKRGIMGQYHHISDRHANAYVTEFCFRHNKRNKTDGFDTLVLKALTN